LADGLHFQGLVKRAAKISDGMVSMVLVCLFLTVALSPRLRRGLVTRANRWRSAHFHRTRGDNRLSSFPRVIFWAWERPEDFRFLEPGRAGVAFLAKTISVLAPGEGSLGDAGATIFVKPRMQPLEVAAGTPLVAVVRIESRAGKQRQVYLPGRTTPDSSIGYSGEQEKSAVAEIVELAGLPNVRAVQIDFDATLSEREFYIGLLKDVRQKLPASLPLSITALASWCIGDRWLAELPAGTIDEAVPMLFRMGPDSANVAAFLRSGEDFRVAACRDTLGVSTDESLSRSILSGSIGANAAFSRDKRIYIFSPRSWTQSAAESVLKEWQP